MTTPPDDFENDPTGMRELLRSLPDPGPMPPEVADRISAALAEEHHDRSGDGHLNVTPLTRPASARPTSRRWMQAVGGLVAAAVAAVAVIGVNSLRHDSAPTSAIPSGGTHRTMSPDQLAGRTQIEATGVNYTDSAFNTQAASLATGSVGSTPQPPLVTEFGSLTKPGALVACARSIAGSLLDDPSSIRVDLATFDGKPAVIIVVTNGGRQTAFAVSSTCSKGDKPYAAPRSI